MLDEFRSTYITWDKATRRIYSPITANESDSNGRKLNIQVVNSGQVENFTGVTLHLYWETKDKMQYGLDAFTASDISKGEFEIFYTTGMLSNIGELNATLVLVDATGKVVSDWFKITVTRGINESAIESENSFSSLTQALIDISDLEQNYTPRLNDLTAQLTQMVINVKTFGAVGDGVTDDLLAIQMAANEAKKVEGSTLFFPPSTGDYIVSDTLNIPATLNVEMIGRVSYGGTSNIPVTVVGSAGEIIHKKRLSLNVTRKNQSDWSSEENIAIKIYNATTSFIKITEATKATIGVQTMGDSKGFAYNYIELGALQENKIAIDVTNANGGWCNENLYISGRFGVSAVNSSLGSRYGIRLTSKNNYINNNNVFLKPSFELGGSVGESIPFLVEWGAGNQVLNARNESPYPITAKFENSSALNYVVLNYGVYQQIDTSTNATNYGNDWRSNQLKSLDRLIFTSLAIKNSVTVDGISVTSDKYFFNNRDGGTELITTGGGITKTTTGLMIPGTRGLGMRFYVSDSKKFVLDKVGAGHFVVRLFNNDNVVLTNGLKYSANLPFAWTTNYGGGYITGSGHEQPIYFEIPENAAYFDIIFYGELSQFNLYSDRVGAVGINPLLT